jgi:hypothetical protein
MMAAETAEKMVGRMGAMKAAKMVEMSVEQWVLMKADSRVALRVE